LDILNFIFSILRNKNGIISIISGQGVFGVRPHAKNTRLPRFIEMIPKMVDKF
jgi:hypothetical protein